MKLYLLTLASVVSLAGCASAHAHPVSSGKWVLNPTKCPDLVEDWRDRQESRRDERYDRGPRDVVEDWVDRQESRRDEAVTHCPASAWEWRGSRYQPRYHTSRPVRAQIYYHPKKHVYYRRSGKNRIVVRF
jgi:hypothetical protein